MATRSINRSSPQAHGLVSFWPLDETVGSIAYDRLDGNPGVFRTTTSGAVTRKVDTLSYHCDFAGVDEDINIAQAGKTYLNATKPFTISIWAYTRSFNGVYPAGGYPEVAKFSFNTGASVEIVLSNQAGYIGYNIGNGGSITGFVGGGTPVLNVWTHICITYNGGGRSNSSSYKLYINGNLQTLSTGGAGSDAFGSAIGNSLAGNQWSRFNGKIRDVRLYNHTLPEVLVKDVYRNPNGIYTSRPSAVLLLSSSSNGTGTGSAPVLTLAPATATATGTTVINGTGTGSAPVLTLAPATATATGTTVINGTGTGSVPELTLAPATATATGTTVGSGTGTGSAPVLTLAPATATAEGTTVGNGTGTGSAPVLTLVAATATATVDGTGTGSAPVLTLVAAIGGANNITHRTGRGTAASLTLVAATATATGTTVINGTGTGSAPTLTLVPSATANATGTIVGNGTGISSAPVLTLVSATATALGTSVISATATGSVPILTASSCLGYAVGTSAGSVAVEVRPPKKTVISHFTQPYYGDLWDKAIHNPMRFR